MSILQYMIFIDYTKCMGCKSCELACAIRHSTSKSIYGMMFEEPKPRPRVQVIKIENYNVALNCRHCEKAPCMSICPTRALYKTEHGVVKINYNACIGCRLCVIACPIAHPVYDYSRKTIVKCDMCLGRYLRERKLPPCVEACPTGALIFGTVDEISKIVKTSRFTEYVKGIIETRENILTTHHRMYERIRWY